MCASKVAVVYGLTVRSASLLFAADAWTRLAPLFAFFDLVLLRVRSDTLKCVDQGGGDAVSQWPKEVWQEIRLWLVLKEVEDSEHGILSPAFQKWFRGRKLKWSTVRERCIGVVLGGWFGEWCGENIDAWNGGQVSAMERLLAYFRLELPFCKPIIGMGKLALRAASLALIAAPSRFLEGESDQVTIDSREGVNGGRDEHSMIDLSLELPPEIDERFTRLVRLFRLEVVDSSINEISPRVLRNEALEDTDEGKKKEFESESELSGIRNIVTREIRPRWLLWTTCEKMNR
ncbi:hypothetical protein JCM16303_002810 [Sporobolomyces ruberrimus]